VFESYGTGDREVKRIEREVEIRVEILGLQESDLSVVIPSFSFLLFPSPSVVSFYS